METTETHQWHAYAAECARSHRGTRRWWAARKARETEEVAYGPIERAAAGMAPLELEEVTSNVTSWAPAVDLGLQIGTDERGSAPAANSWAGRCAVNWSLHLCARGESLLVCNIKRARKRLTDQLRKEDVAAGRKGAAKTLRERVKNMKLTVTERDARGLVFYPKDIVPAILGSYTNRLLVGGDRLGGKVRWMTAEEEAKLMGIGAGSRVDRRRSGKLASNAMNDKELRRATADAIDRGMAHALTDKAIKELRERQPPYLRTRTVTYAAMGPGAFDGIGYAIREIEGRCDCKWIAEIDGKRMRVAAAELQAARMHGDALDPKVAAEEHVDILGVTWPCQKVTTALQCDTTSWEERKEEADASMLDCVKAVTAYATRARPYVIVLEQAAGVATHHKATMRRLDAGLRRMPYTWSSTIANATQFGARHNRSRVLWVGVLRQ